MCATTRVLLLWLVWTASCDARRVKLTKGHLVLKAREKVYGDSSSNVSLITAGQNKTQILCFGLCIAALGGVGLFFIVGAGTAVTVGVGYAANAVLDHLSENGVEVEQIRKMVADAAAYAQITDDVALTKEERMHTEAVTAVSWTSREFLAHIWSSCGTFMEAKGLGDSASSSKSGAVFFNCENTLPTADHPRMLVKGAIRDSDSSPEWQNFQILSQDSGLVERYSDSTLLNKMVLGFDAYDLHWLVLEDVKATRVLHRLQSNLKIAFLELDLPDFNSYDIKPAGSRAPQLPGCLHRLEELAKTMGPIHEFKGWDRIVETLDLDLAFLKTHSIIDESIFVQVAGPFDVDENSVEKAGIEAVLEELGGTPMCAYQVKDGKMALVCVAILDYVLSMTFMKSVQNTFQFSRWDNYEDKMRTLLSCLGDLSQDECGDFHDMASEDWLEVVKADYAEHLKKESFENAMGHLEDNYRCCCNTKETKDKLTMGTACAWLRRKNQTTSMGFCPGDLQHYSAADGGCLDLEPPALPPPKPSSRCSFYHSCCCYDRDWYPHSTLPVTENGLCSCVLSCPSEGHRKYDEVAYCPTIHSFK